MKRILLISDTHSILDNRLIKHIKEVDEVWHAGDVGRIEVCDEISKHCSILRVVYGNIDDNVVRAEFQKNVFFDCEGAKVWLTHIGGYPPKYRGDIKQEITKSHIDIFICGHSHILRVMYDKNLQCLHLNPGACGQYGIHQVQTALKFVVEKSVVKEMEIIELKKR